MPWIDIILARDCLDRHWVGIRLTMDRHQIGTGLAVLTFEWHQIEGGMRPWIYQWHVKSSAVGTLRSVRIEYLFPAHVRNCPPIGPGLARLLPIGGRSGMLFDLSLLWRISPVPR